MFSHLARLKKVIIIFSVLVGSLFCQQSFAALSCSKITSAFTLNTGNIIVQRDAAIGQPISNVISAGYTPVYDCSGEVSLIGVKSYLSSNSVASNGAVIYKTNIPGIGITIGGITCGGSNSRFVGQTSGLRWYGADWIYMCATSGTTATWASAPSIQLYKIDSASSGQLSGQIGSMIAGTALIEPSSGSWQSEVPISLSGTVTVVACSISTSSIQVPLDDVLASSLTAVGSTAKPKDFSLGLNCDAGARINVSMAGQQHSDTSATGVLQLSNPLSAGTATGVGIQILYNSSPMPLNTNMVLKTSAGGVETFPFTARYYQTRGSVTTGTANATATLNITYQ